MRTHKIVYTCNSAECAAWYKREILDVAFCDLTHWYCGLDGAGDDTPDTCIIYRGIIHPEVITVEVDENSGAIRKNEDDTFTVSGVPCSSYSFDIGGKHFEVLSVKVEELESYKELKKARQAILNLWPNKHF